ncbi:MAG: hypothetical protein R3F11_06630 [Verrucomicrobiales bacterium]
MQRETQEHPPLPRRLRRLQAPGSTCGATGLFTDSGIGLFLNEETARFSKSTSTPNTLAISSDQRRLTRY